MNKYLITLRPVDKFYFGGEITFRRENEDKFNETYGSYIVRSNLFPQQTSLLGMLRFLYLSNSKTLFQNGSIIKGKQSEVVDLIGPESFKFSGEKGDKREYGKIKKIHPCFIQCQMEENSGWETILQAPLDHKLEISFTDRMPEISGYKPKDGLHLCYLSNGNVVFNESDLFVEDARIGINRDYEGITQEDSYYKQIFYRFSDQYKQKGKGDVNHSLRFAFYAELEDAGFLLEKEHIVSLGGDNSRFALKIEEVNDIQYPLPSLYKPDNYKNCHGKIILLSDAYVEKEKVKSSLFHISDIVSFRFLESSVNKSDNYYKFSGEALTRNKDKYNLYKKGSVFFFEKAKDIDEFERTLNEYKQLCQIGYNRFERI